MIRKHYLGTSAAFAVILLFVFQSFGFAVVRLDPRVFLLSQHPERLKYDPYSGALHKKGDAIAVDVVVTLTDPDVVITGYDLKMLMRHHEMAVIRTHPRNLSRLSNHAAVRYIESSVPLFPHLDKSLADIGIPELRSQYAYDGKDVIIGIVDTGIDWRHESFRNPDGSTRIRYLLDLSLDGPVLGGTVFTETEINRALQQNFGLQSFDVSGHGTHVAAIAAGDGSNNAEYGPYTGVAPAADLVVVKATRDMESRIFQSIDQILALSFIDSVASILDKPYVVNLSFGGHFGAHDGTSSIERFIDKITGPGIAGKAVVTVAGNNGDDAIHSVIDFESAASRQEMTFRIPLYSPNPENNDDVVQIDCWYPGTEKVEIELVSPSGDRFGPVAPGDYIETGSDEGLIYIWNSFYEKNGRYIRGCNPFNGDCEIYIEINDARQQTPASGEWKLVFTASGGVADIYLANASMDVEFTGHLRDQGSIAIPGTAKNVITVGSFVSKTSWYDLDDHFLTINPFDRLGVGALSPFSSPGPTRDGRIKPDLCAPGQMIASARSRNANPANERSVFYSSFRLYPNAFILQDSTYGISSGTSMAAPHAVGVTALLLQQNPALSAYQLAQMLRESTLLDEFVEYQPNPYWGWGKLNGYQAIRQKAAEEPVVERFVLQNYPNPFLQMTCIEVDIPADYSGALVTLKIYNHIGQYIQTLLQEALPSNRYAFYWDGTDKYGFKVASGVYFLELVVGSRRQIKKLAFLGHK